MKKIWVIIFTSVILYAGCRHDEVTPIKPIPPAVEKTAPPYNDAAWVDIEYRWNTVLLGDPNNLTNTPGIVNSGQTTANSKVPPEVAKSIRVYSRYYDLRIQ